MAFPGARALMELTLALLADYANVSQEGKLNVLGIFNVIVASSVPSRVPVCHLVLRFTADASEKGSKKQVQFKLLDPDGKQLMDVSGELEIQPGGPPGPVTIDLLSPIEWLAFEQYGEHQLSVLVNGEHKRSIGVTVASPPTPPKEDP